MKTLLCLCLLAAACGGSDKPGNVRAAATAAGVEVSWDAVFGAASYTVQLVDFDSGPVGDAVVVRGTHVTLPGTAAGVWVDAMPGSRAMAAVTAGSGGGSAATWQLFGPADFKGGTLTASFPELQAGERLGVLLIHSGGADNTQATVEMSGVANAAAAKALTLSRSAAMPVHSQHDAVRAAQALEVSQTLAAPEPVADADKRGFCVVQGLDFSRRVRKPATRALRTDHADFFIDDEDAAHYSPDFISQLGTAYESNVWPADTTAFGFPTDVDGNGRIIILLTHELGAHLNGGWLIGYFGNADLTNARDDSAACSGNGSNHGEIVYLNDVQNGMANGWSAGDLSATVYPETLAHEIQHLLNLTHRCIEKKCDGPQETWLNEGLSKVAEDLAGYGWNSSIGRGEGARYLSRTGNDAALRGYDGRSLTVWEGDPIGSYQGVHSFVRYFADRLGVSVATHLALGADVETTLQRPWPRAMAEWASALLLSNEAGAPFSYSGDGWSPLHERLRELDTRAPGTASLRKDGIAAFLSGAGQGAPAKVIVRAADATWVVVVRTSAPL
ncbi:MAG TPA: hypothetical protein VH083_21325 [Myxococcales bacterium]|nr:hypothetical protein [Myxococcales bacterium]